MASRASPRAGEQCARWQLSGACVWPRRSRRASPSCCTACPRRWKARSRTSTRSASSLRRAHLCDVRVCRFEGERPRRAPASAAREGPRLLQKVSDCRVCCESQRRPGPRRRAASSGERTAGSRCPSTTTRTGPPRSSARGGRRRLGASGGAARVGRRHGRGRQRRGESAVSRAVRFAIQTARGRDRLQMARALKCVAAAGGEGRGPLRGELPRRFCARRARGGARRGPGRDHRYDTEGARPGGHRGDGGRRARGADREGRESGARINKEARGAGNHGPEGTRTRAGQQRTKGLKPRTTPRRTRPTPCTGEAAPGTCATVSPRSFSSENGPDTKRQDRKGPRSEVPHPAC